MRPLDTSLNLTLPLAADPLLRKRYMIIDRELPGNIRFGLLLEDLDKLAEETALAYIRRSAPEGRTVTAAIDNIYIRRAADITRDLTLRARINFVGTSSLEVGIRVEHSPAPGDHIASCYFTMVARSGTGGSAGKEAPARSLPLPPLDYSEPLENRREKKALAHRAAHRIAKDAALAPPAADEYARLAALHGAQEKPGFSGLLAAQAVTTTWERMYPEFENVPQKIFGGYLIRRAYENAALCAEEVGHDRPVIVAVNRINFLQPVRMGDKLRFVSRAAFTGENSVAVETDIIRISRDRSESALSNSCIFTFVNVDEAGLTPCPVVPVYPTTYAEDARWLAGHRRRVAHLAWKAGGRRKS